MLQLTIPDAPAASFWDENKEVFVEVPECKGAVVQLEHSLISISKWESKWHKSYLSTKEKTPEEIIDYIRCMNLTKNVRPEVFDHLTEENIKQVFDYINDPMTATTIKRKPGKGASRKVITSEQIYSWMIDAEMKVDYFDKWHINRLLTMIELRNIGANPGKKMSQKNIMKDNAALNAARRAKSHSRG